MEIELKDTPTGTRWQKREKVTHIKRESESETAHTKRNNKTEKE
ncbi:MAG: hypothetical protein ABIH89_04045 [Elusimicrobiota bacterium]